MDLPGELGDLAQGDHRGADASARRKQHREVAVRRDDDVAVRGGAVEDLGVEAPSSRRSATCRT